MDRILFVLKKINNVFINALIVIVFLLLVLAIYNYIQIKVLNNNYTNFLGYTFFEVQTGSMEPKINIDDYVFIKITKNVKKNDIITYFDGDELITHRLIDITGEVLYTKGDNNSGLDEPIEKENVIGKVVFIGENYGKYMDIITEPRVFISVIITIILFNIALFGSKRKEVKCDEK